MQSKLKRNKILRLFSNVEWIFIFFFVFCYSSYIGLVTIWLILGAIINPNNFLVYATTSLTFVTFVVTKYNQFKNLSKNGFKIVSDMVFSSLQVQLSSIAEVMIKDMKKVYFYFNFNNFLFFK